MTIQQLRYFIALAEHLHFGEAAKACFISQPSLSNSIAELEAELELKLFDRSSRNVELTLAGESFYADSRDIIKRIGEAINNARRADMGILGRLKIGALGGLSAGYFPSRVKEFGEKHPNISIKYQITNMRAINTEILKGIMDIAITRKIDIDNRYEQLAWTVLYKDRFGLVVHKDNPLAIRETIDLKELTNEPFVFLDKEVTPNVYAYTLQLRLNRGLKPKITNTAATLEIACTLIKAGLGIAILPDCALSYGVDELKFISIDGDDMMSDVVLVWNKGNENPVLPIFLDEFGISIYSDILENSTQFKTN